MLRCVCDRVQHFMVMLIGVTGLLLVMMHFIHVPTLERNVSYR